MVSACLDHDVDDDDNDEFWTPIPVHRRLHATSRNCSYSRKGRKESDIISRIFSVCWPFSINIDKWFNIQSAYLHAPF